jgi:predicted enzyme related to lactoylglutathione lyase
VIDADVFDFAFNGCAVLLHTGWDRHWGTPSYVGNDHPYVTEAAAHALVSGGAALVGIDSLNIDSTTGNERPVHTHLLAAAIPIVEHLSNLAAVPARGATFSAVPIKVAGLGTFSVRAYASVPARSAVCEIVFDVADVRAMAAYWATALTGGVAQVRSDDWATVRDPRPGGVLLAFQRVPESKQAKNRVHLDIWSDDIPSDTERLEAAGAARIGAIVTDEAGAFQVLTDPEGNEFCLVGE